MSRKSTIALIGPDGAGKSTIASKLEQVLPLPMKYMYMGVNLESSNLMLPTTRLLLKIKRSLGERPDMTTRPPEYFRAKASNESTNKQVIRSLRSTVRVVNLIAEEWFRQFIIWRYTRRGYYVILDRHFYFDYYAHDIQSPDLERPIYSRIHGFILEKLYPKPDFVIFLDAPSEILFARKPEGTLEACERRRQEYIQLRGAVINSAVVDVSQPLEKVVDEVCRLIVKYHSEHNGNSRG